MALAVALLELNFFNMIKQVSEDVLQKIKRMTSNRFRITDRAIQEAIYRLIMIWPDVHS
jgi:hypothetical protein